MAWSPDSTQIASSAREDDANIVRIWDVKTGQSLFTLAGHTGAINEISWSHDGKLLATASNDQTVRVWDYSTRQTIHVLSDYSGSVTDVAWSANGNWLATTGIISDKLTALLWDTRTYKASTVYAADEYLGGLTWNPDSTQLAMIVWATQGAYVNEVRIWDVASKKVILTLKDGSRAGAVTSISWNPNGKTLTTSSSDALVNEWDARTGKLLALLNNYSRPVLWVGWQPEGNLLAAAHYEASTLDFFNSSTGNLTALIDTSSVVEDTIQPAFSWSPDGKFVAGMFVTPENVTKIWGIGKPSEPIIIKNTGRYPSVSWSPDGKKLATVGDVGSSEPDWKLFLWNAQTGTQLSQLQDSRGQIFGAFWSPHWKWVATFTSTNPTANEGKVGLQTRDASTFAILQEFPDKQLPDANLVWDEAANTLFGYVPLSSGSVKLLIWDLNTNTVTTPFPELPEPDDGNAPGISSNLVLRADGRVLAAGSDDTLYLWDVKTHQLLAQLVEGGNINSIAWNADGTKLAAGNGDGSIHIYQIDYQDSLAG